MIRSGGASIRGCRDLAPTLGVTKGVAGPVVAGKHGGARGGLPIAAVDSAHSTLAGSARATAILDCGRGFHPGAAPRNRISSVAARARGTTHR